jgi:MFS family permease
LSSFIADRFGITPFPFYLGIGISIIGLILSLFFVKDTRAFVNQELIKNHPTPLKGVFLETSFKNKTLSSITQAGLVNNLNDGMIWGLLPVLLFSLDFSIQKIGILTAIYPSIWGLGQLFTGKLADLYSKKGLLFWGMLLQGLAILMLPALEQFQYFIMISVLLGLGTALVYPTFLAAIAEATSPLQRAESIGTFRLWRDLGYAIGAIISGITADWLGVVYAILLIGIITVLSALVIQVRMPIQPISNS